MKNTIRSGVLLSTLGILLSAITAHGTVQVQQVSEADQVAAAEILTDMIQKGFVQVGSNGEMRINGSIYSILKQYDAVGRLNEPTLFSACSKTSACCARK
jgi:hypothetical protein